MEITLEGLQARRAELVRQKDQFLAQANQAQGTGVLVDDLIAELRKPPPETEDADDGEAAT